MSALAYTTAKMPGGTIAVVIDAGVVVASSFRGIADIRSRLSTELFFKKAALPTLEDLLDRYRGGELAALDEVEVAQFGGPFQQGVWVAMRTIEPGTTDTYGGLAMRAGRPRAYRAVGTACSVNLVAPFVPCHRVVAASGIGGYGYGLDVKRALLKHEGASFE
ncbi:MAG: methylated-DNA--[protein]-cysteine S-methyltransferase [Candidatus Nanopelagicales bacterium]|nr:methylated-DNA--[protein]-cysteine S-methyltransferase [Candidatus Nanopelagicales bacterium]